MPSLLWTISPVLIRTTIGITTLDDTKSAHGETGPPRGGMSKIDAFQTSCSPRRV